MLRLRSSFVDIVDKTAGGVGDILVRKEGVEAVSDYFGGPRVLCSECYVG